MNQMKKLEGRVAIVTGARKGIGKAESVALAAEGAKIVACDINEEMADLRKEVAAVVGKPSKTLEEHRKTVESQVPVGFVGEADRDLVPIIVFLASDASRYMTGHPFFIDGGGANSPR